MKMNSTDIIPYNLNDENLQYLITALSHSYKSGVTCKQHTLDELKSRAGHRSFDTNLSNEQNDIYIGWRNHVLTFINAMNTHHHIGARFLNTQATLVEKLPMQNTDSIINAVDKTYEDSLKILNEIIDDLYKINREEKNNHNAEPVKSVSDRDSTQIKVSLFITGKTLKFKLQNKDYMIKKFNSTNSNNFKSSDKLLKENKPLTKSELGLTKSATKLQDLASSMGLKGILRDTFLEIDGDTIRLVRNTSVPPIEAQELIQYVNSLNKDSKDY